MTFDIGHAPCPFDTLNDLANIRESSCRWKYSKLLSLSNCARGVRAGASEGDWVLGIAGAELQNLRDKLLWIGKVNRKISKAEYFKMNVNGIYDLNSRPDNYYGKEIDYKQYQESILGYPQSYVMFKNPFHDLSAETDLNPPIVLLFEEFWYFGRKAVIDVPIELKALGQEAKILDDKKVNEFAAEIKAAFPGRGVYGLPVHLDSLREEDSASESWRGYILRWIASQNKH